jgi:class 3 adenylate cyclase
VVVQGDDEVQPWPDDPVLAHVARALERSGHWAAILDADWRLVYVTSEMRRTVGAGADGAFAMGDHYFGADNAEVTGANRIGSTTLESRREQFVRVGGLILHDLDGDRERLRSMIEPGLHDLVDTIEPIDAEAVFSSRVASAVTGSARVAEVLLRFRDATGRLAGTALLAKPDIGMFTMALLTIEGDRSHLERMQLVSRAARRPAAILFADLESSTPLAKRLPTAGYFTLSRRLLRAADRCVVEAGGLVGRHVGDGVAAFFLAEIAGSESAAARACITAARRLVDAVATVAERQGLDPADVVLRFGLHWGATPYIGNITTAGRSEVTAMGDEVNETARIEACAQGGRMLASKSLVERLEPGDAAALGIDAEHVAYTLLADLDGADVKALRDAATIAVCDLAER